MSAVVVTPELVRDLASHPEGTRAVQRALDEARSDDERRELALQFKGHVWSAAVCPYANYALQKVIATLRPSDVQFIIDELSCRSDLCLLARHKFGCRVLQRLFEHCRADQVHHLGDILLTECIQLCRHSYGNYVMQQLTHGSDEHHTKLASLLARQIKSVASNISSLGVLSLALEVCDAEQRLNLGRIICDSKGLLVKLAQQRHGHRVALSALEAFLSDSTEHEKAYAQLQSARDTLSNTRYGRRVLSLCERDSAQLDDEDVSPRSAAKLE